jgi:aubergine-like protein
MVIGINVYTDTSSNHKRTVTAFVSSMNSNVILPEQSNITTTAFTRWYSKCMIEENEQKYSDLLRFMMFDAIKKYNEINGTLPEWIFVYRDGLSDNQFELLKEIEIGAMKEAFKQIGPDYR